MKKSEWIDISIALSNELEVWPGDTPFSYQLSYTKEETGSSNIGEIRTSVHNGTHIDAPFHFDQKGQTIDELDVNTFVKQVCVVDVTGVETIKPAHLSSLSEGDYSGVLFHTMTRDDHTFPEIYPVISDELAPFLQARGIDLIGTDAPSVDPIDSKSLSAHHACLNNEIALLENLKLNTIAPGLYQLIALPLKIKRSDASPVRAIIRPI
ncbi:Kynurenine formamidase [Pelagirhabdus alkalitolerans]|uniref:Arylformamidase n=1 Tax=Pelagirhabdus alkalitolerans TaxID=1612202 RepID=A0A1G6GMB6_9BACI|nr:arylformamidase [Pelagirhabdus alkalitolerans]SDB83150.1 Kynurenine formamidase [Pelagirhabdus alkalitolerans]